MRPSVVASARVAPSMLMLILFFLVFPLLMFLLLLF